MIRLGMLDFDTSHTVEFTRHLNHVGIEEDQWVDGARVVVGCPGASRIAPERIPGFRSEMERHGVPLVADPWRCSAGWTGWWSPPCAARRTWSGPDRSGGGAAVLH